MELCERFQRRNERIFGERQQPDQRQPSNVTSNPSLKKEHENAPSNTHSTRLPSVSEQQIRQSRSRSKLVGVALPQQMKKSDVLCQRTTQRQVSECATPQGMNRKPQQAKKITSKTSVARQNVADKNAGKSGGRRAFKDDITIHRPSLGHPKLKSGTSSRRLELQTVSKQVKTCESKPSTEGHQRASSQLQKVRSDQMKPRRRRVGGMNEVMPERRVAFQQETSEVLQCTDRRIGQCSQTDPAQPHLTFIRVLRKRF